MYNEVNKTNAKTNSKHKSKNKCTQAKQNTHTSSAFSKELNDNHTQMGIIENKFIFQR